MTKGICISFTIFFFIFKFYLFVDIFSTYSHWETDYLTSPLLALVYYLYTQSTQSLFYKKKTLQLLIFPIFSYFLKQLIMLMMKQVKLNIYKFRISRKTFLSLSSHMPRNSVLSSDKSIIPCFKMARKITLCFFTLAAHTVIITLNNP